MVAEADGASKRFGIPGGLDGFFQCPTTQELLELAKAIDHRNSGAHVRAETPALRIGREPAHAHVFEHAFLWI
jgi:hypothetical protein